MAGFKNSYLSVSRLRRYEECPLAFKLHYIDQLESKSNDALRLGNLLHAVLESYYQWVIDDEFAGRVDLERLLDLYRDEWAEAGLSGFSAYDEGLRMLRAYVQDNALVDHRDVLAVEQEFHLDIGGFEVFGKIDRVDRVGDHAIEVIDYKSNRNLYTREEVETDLQLSVYAMAARKIWPWAKEIRLGFYMLRHGIKQTTVRDTATLAATREYLVALGQQTENSAEYPANINTNCQYCDHSAHCPAYQGALAGDVEVVSAEQGDLEGLAAERERLSSLAGILYKRKKQLDDVLRAQLKSVEKLDLGPKSYTLQPYAEQTVYPVGATLRAFSSASGMSESELRETLLVIDKNKVDALVKKLSKKIPRARHRLLRAELDAIAEKGFGVRLQARKIQATSVKAAGQVPGKDAAGHAPGKNSARPIPALGQNSAAHAQAPDKNSATALAPRKNSPGPVLGKGSAGPAPGKNSAGPDRGKGSAAHAPGKNTDSTGQAQGKGKNSAAHAPAPGKAPGKNSAGHAQGKVSDSAGHAPGKEGDSADPVHAQGKVSDSAGPAPDQNSAAHAQVPAGRDPDNNSAGHAQGKVTAQGKDSAGPVPDKNSAGPDPEKVSAGPTPASTTQSPAVSPDPVAGDLPRPVRGQIEKSPAPSSPVPPPTQPQKSPAPSSSTIGSGPARAIVRAGTSPAPRLAQAEKSPAPSADSSSIPGQPKKSPPSSPPVSDRPAPAMAPATQQPDPVSSDADSPGSASGPVPTPARVMKTSAPTQSPADLAQQSGESSPSASRTAVGQSKSALPSASRSDSGHRDAPANRPTVGNPAADSELAVGNPGAGSAKAPAKAPTQAPRAQRKPPRPLVFIDCETTGLDPAKHEILELAAIRVRPRDWQIETLLSLKIRPERIESADPKALRLNGYDERVWAEEAVSLAEAMEQLAPVLEGTTIAGHNVAFDRNFLEAAWQSAGHRPTKLDYHLLDTASLAWPLLLSGQIDSVSLAPVCEYLGIDQGEQHRAYNDARASLEVAKRLLSVFSTSVTSPSPVVLGSVSPPPIPVETRRQRSPKKPAIDQPELVDSRPPPQYRRKDGTPDRRPVRRCRSRHQCDTCNTDIVSGEKYLDGGPSKRTHLRCAEPI